MMVCSLLVIIIVTLTILTFIDGPIVLVTIKMNLLAFLFIHLGNIAGMLKVLLQFFTF